MNQADFAYLAEVLRRRTGILLTDKKTHLVESRLVPVIRRFGFKDVGALLRELHHGHEALVHAVIEAMTTNDSAFFRDRKTYEEFRDIVLPRLLISRAASKELRIWCAACAAGQEPFSIAMILDDFKLAAHGWSITLIGSDINSQMIARAEAGIYSQFEVQRGLPIRYLVRDFEPEGERWHLKPAIRDKVQFRIANLLEDVTGLGRFDVILCRNVLIYFEQETKTAVLDRLARLLPPDGFLFLGGAETTLGVSNHFEPLADQRGLYRPAMAAAVRG